MIALTSPAGRRLALPTPKPPSDYFGSIVRSIVSQQISTRAAEAVFGRIILALDGLPKDRRTDPTITPARLLALPEETLKACGLSGQKMKYIRHNAQIWDTLDTSDFPTLPDEMIITKLTKLYGVGRWTAEMFLIFTLARPDVFSFGDWGLMQSLYQHYPYRPHHTRKVATLVESWSPHRTLAALTLWWHKDAGTVALSGHDTPITTMVQKSPGQHVHRGAVRSLKRS
jgi:DNA-3-methyladenine glycosylase II